MSQKNNRTQNPEEYMRELEHKVTIEYPQKLENLIKFRDAMTDVDVSNCFDQQDIDWVEEEIRKVSQSLSQAQKEWTHKNHLYNDTLLGFEEVLRTREKVLNQVNNETELFKVLPSLREQFVKKQVDMLKNLEALLKKLYEE